MLASDKEFWRPKPSEGLRLKEQTAARLLIGFAVTLMVLAAIGLLIDRDSALVGLLALLALLAMLAAAFAPRMAGQVKAGLTGFQFELVRSVADHGPTVGLSAEQLATAVKLALVESTGDTLKATGTVTLPPIAASGKGSTGAPPARQSAALSVDSATHRIIDAARGTWKAHSDTSVAWRGEAPADTAQKEEERP